MIEFVVSRLKVPRKFDVILKNNAKYYSDRGGSSGYFYQGGTFTRYKTVTNPDTGTSEYKAVCKPFKRKARVMINLASNENVFPIHHKYKSGGYLPDFFQSREEYLIHILAHELRHFWQKKHSRINRKMWRAWHSKRKSSFLVDVIPECPVYA
jgi:hypothetical protein